MEPQRDETLTRKISEEFGPLGEFKPFVHYDKELDWIEVVTEDCSFAQVRASGRFPEEFSLHERKYPEEGRLHVGFTFGGARIFCKENGLPIHGSVSLSALLRKKAEVDAEARLAILDVAIPLLEDFNEHKLDEVTFPA